MLAVSLTLVFATYVLGPDLFSRFILGFIVARKSLTLTRSEEISRAVIWSIAPLALSWAWAHWFGPFDRLSDPSIIRICFSGIYSEEYFRKHDSAWFDSMQTIMWLNYCLLWRIYVIVGILSLFLNHVIKRYESWRHRFRNHPRLRSLLATLVLPRIAPWHLLLSGILLRGEHLHLDIMTKSNVLYQGRLADKMLGSDGALISITLAEPRRFRWEEYVEDRKARKSQPPPLPKAKAKEDYWANIPTNLFVVMGSEIHSINLRYVPTNVAALRRPGNDDADLNTLLSQLKIKVTRIKENSFSGAEDNPHSTL